MCSRTTASRRARKLRTGGIGRDHSAPRRTNNTQFWSVGARLRSRASGGASCPRHPPVRTREKSRMTRACQQGSRRVRSALAAVAAAMLAALGQPVAARAAKPVASFSFAPQAPHVGETVTFTSTATDPDSDIIGWLWDLDGNGDYRDGWGRAVRAVF